MTASKIYNFPEGELLLVDKPAEWTSFDVVNKIRHMLRHHLGIKKIKVGHAGTLDPLATGLLLVCVGKQTKQISTYTGLDKEYVGTFYLGATTPSYDCETEVDEEFETGHITDEMIRDSAKTFIGTISQVPPVFSAIWVGGTRAHKRARDKEDVKMVAREVKINAFEIKRAEVPEIDFRVECGKGTYIRSLAYDFGKALHSGAYLKNLRRTKIGEYHVGDAFSIPELEEVISKQKQSS